MANLQKAKQAAQQLGQQPPEGISQGTPQYDQWVQDWFDAGVRSGDQRLLDIAGPEAGGYQAEEGGHVSDWKSAAPSSEWLGKRKPTAQELRRWAHDTGRSEDYERFPDAAVSGWIARNWDVNAGSFRNNYGDLVDKPDERGPNTPANVNGTGDMGNYGAGGDGGGAQGAAAQPAKPVTNGSQLSMTGNPLQDMLIQQFNTGQNPETLQGNMFSLGEDMRVGGTGKNADQGNAAPTRIGQSLSGGGLWWGQDKDTFSDFDASQKNAEGAMTASPAARPATTPTATSPAAAPQNIIQSGNIGGTVGRAAQRGYKGLQTPTTTPMSGMVTNQFNNPARSRPSYF
jgi:hypothetical protein